MEGDFLDGVYWEEMYNQGDDDWPYKFPCVIDNEVNLASINHVDRFLRPPPPCEQTWTFGQPPKNLKSLILKF